MIEDEQGKRDWTINLHAYVILVSLMTSDGFSDIFLRGETLNCMQTFYFVLILLPCLLFQSYETYLYIKKGKQSTAIEQRKVLLGWLIIISTVALYIYLFLAYQYLA